MNTNSTARKPQASDTAAKRQDTTLAIPLEQRPPAHGGFAECAQIMRKADASVGSLPLPAGVPSESPPGSASGLNF